MNRDEVEQAIKQFKWHQTMPLGDGIYTPGERSYEYLVQKLNMMQLAEDLSGNSLLDIGCSEGFLSSKRGRGELQEFALWIREKKYLGNSPW